VSHPRIQVDDQTPELRPNTPAQSTDTYVRADTSDSQGAQLAQALSSLAPELARFGNELFVGQQKKDALKNKNDVLAGTQAARDTITAIDDSRSTYADAVRDGKIPAFKNPWMKQGYYEELGRSYGDRLNADMTAAIQTDANLNQSVEMSDFRKFTSDFEQNWLKTNVPGEIQNPAFQVGYGARRDAHVANLEDGWAAQTEQRFTHRTLAMFGDESQNFIHDALDKGRSVEDIGTVLRTMWDDKHSLGWDARLTGTTLVDAISNAAIDRRDPELFRKLLDAVPAGKDGSRLSSAYSTKIELETRAKIADATRDDWAATAHARSEESRSIATDAGTRFVEAEKNNTPLDSIDVSDLQKRALANGDVPLERQIATMRTAYGKAEYVDDPDTVARLSVKLHTSAFALKQSDLDLALQHQRLSLSTYNSMSSTLREYGNYANEQGRIGQPGFLEKDNDYQTADRQLRSQFIGTNGLETGELAHAREQASQMFTDLYYNQFVDPAGQNHGLTGQPRYDAMKALAFNIKQKWLPDAAGSGAYTLKGSDLDYKKVLVDTPDRVRDWTDELYGILRKTSTAAPSPGLISVLRTYGINPSDTTALFDFVNKQRELLPPPPPPRRKTTH
jgi:hypothetical protein